LAIVGSALKRQRGGDMIIMLTLDHRNMSIQKCPIALKVCNALTVAT